MSKKQCKSIVKKTGKRCKNNAKDGSDYCRVLSHSENAKDKQKKREERAKELFMQANDVIDKFNLFTIRDIYEYMVVSESTFYDYIRGGSEMLGRLKEKLKQNRVKTKIQLRNKWYKSESTTAQIALYKLICDNDEYHRLANTKHQVDTTINDKRPDYSKLSDVELNQLEKLLTKAEKND